MPMKAIKLLFALLATTVALMAQPRLYIVPVIGTGSQGDPRRPEYFSDRTLVHSQWSGIDYGSEPVMVVGADLAPSEDAFIAAQSDVFALPFDLDSTITAAGPIQNALENRNIPGSWVANGMSYRQMVRTVLGMFSLFQRMAFVYASQNGGQFPGSVFTLGLTLNGTFQTQPVSVQNAFIATAGEFGFAWTYSGNTTMRVILKALADSFGTRTYYLGVVTI